MGFTLIGTMINVGIRKTLFLVLYFKDDRAKVRDTIILTKEIVNDKDYTKWIFKTNKEFTILGGKQGDKTHPSIGFGVVGSWYFDKALKIIKIDRGNYYSNYSILNYQANKIILIRIK